MERKNPKCSPYDLRALEAWLAELAAGGWELAGEWPYFEKAEQARERQFYIEPAQEKGGVPRTLLDSRALLGWEYVCSMDKGAFYVWRSVGKTANTPRPRELAGSWCDKRLTRHLRNWWLGMIAIFTVYAGYVVYACLNAAMPLWSLLTNRSAQWTSFSLLLTLFCGLWATRREHRDLRRLRRAVRAGEYQEPVAQHKAWYAVMNWLPLAIAAAALLATCVAASTGRLESGYDTFLCDVAVEREGDWAHTIDHYRWAVYATQLEVYRPRVGALAKPLAAELRGFYGMEPADTPDGVDEAWYCPDYALAQYLLLRRGDTVLLYRTDAPGGLRGRSGELAALLAADREAVLTR